MSTSMPVLRPERLRQIERPFGWLPCRLITDGLLTSISPSARQLYLVLALAADRRGLSRFGDNRLQRVLAFSASDLDSARAELLKRDWIAFDGATYQLLSLPPTAPPAPAPLLVSPPDHSPQSAPAPILDDSPPRAERQAIPQEAREILRRIFGPDFR